MYENWITKLPCDEADIIMTISSPRGAKLTLCSGVMEYKKDRARASKAIKEFMRREREWEKLQEQTR